MNRKGAMLFLIGALSMTQVRVVGYIGVSELAMLLVGPWVLVRNSALLQRQGFGKFLMLAMLWAIGALVANLSCHNTAGNTLRGVAAPLAVLFGVVVLHALLHDNLIRIRYLLVGFAVTTILSLFWLQPGSIAAVASYAGVSAKEAALGYKLTQVSIAMTLLCLPIQLAYLRVPNLSLFLTLALAVFGLLQGGRSTFLVMLLSVVLMAVVRGRVQGIRQIRRRIPLVLLMLLAASAVAAGAYRFAATQGLMGEAEREKYEQQAHSSIGLLSGRGEVIAALLAIRDAPILGYGSWMPDVNDYRLKAMELTGADDESIRLHLSMTANRYYLLPGHSHILSAWVENGIFGGVFWVYVLLVLWRLFRQNMGVVPELYGYLALSLPTMLWAILFSPLGQRQVTAAMIVCALLIQHMARVNQRVRQASKWAPAPVAGY